MRLAVFVSVLFVVIPAGAFAQGSDTPVELQETGIFGMGARALGMGAAYTAVSEDVSAMLYNPAGLAQVRRVELSGGLVNNNFTRDVTHVAKSSDDLSSTRLDHLALAYPFPTYRGSLVGAVSFRRMVDLDMGYFKEGFLVDATPGSSGLYELEEFQRDGIINAYSAAIAVDLSPHISVGASLTYLNGQSDEDLVLANYRAVDAGNAFDLDIGGDDFNDRGDEVFYQETNRSADVTGYTGSVGILAYLDNGIRLGAAIDLPTQLTYDGTSDTYFEDWEKIDEYGQSFEDDITLPLSVSGGVSWGREGLLLSGGFRWTDYKQIDFEGEILAPPEGATLKREPAYRSVVAVNLGAEYQIPNAPVRVRAGFFTEPLPYKLIAADTDFEFIPDDGNANTIDDASIVYRDYPEADIVSDRKYWTLGAGVLVEDALTIDAAIVFGSWERSTPAGYQNFTEFFATTATTEEVSQTRIVISSTMHFE